VKLIGVPYDNRAPSNDLRLEYGTGTGAVRLVSLGLSSSNVLLAPEVGGCSKFGILRINGSRTVVDPAIPARR